MNIDEIATRAFQAALCFNPQITLLEKITPEELDNFFVMWREGNTYYQVKDYAIAQKTSGDKWSDKKVKILFTKSAVLKSTYFDTTIILIQGLAKEPILIIDGIHRAIGIRMASLENKNVSVNLRGILITSPNMSNCIADYSLLVQQ